MYEPKHLKRWTVPDSYFGAQWPDYYSSGVGRSRDSDDLEESNFAIMLRDLGGESETVLVIRESHWAVGWVEWIAIHREDEKSLRIADKNKSRMADYPVLDEEDWSARETESANKVWANCYDEPARIKYIRDNRSQFDFFNWSDLRAQVRGDYFGGYASELLH